VGVIIVRAGRAGEMENKIELAYVEWLADVFFDKLESWFVV